MNELHFTEHRVVEAGRVVARNREVHIVFGPSKIGISIFFVISVKFAINARSY